MLPPLPVLRTYILVRTLVRALLLSYALFYPSVSRDHVTRGCYGLVASPTAVFLPLKYVLYPLRTPRQQLILCINYFHFFYTTYVQCTLLLSSSTNGRVTAAAAS